MTGKHEVLTEDQIRWAYRRWCEGYALPVIADALFIHSTTLGKVFQRRGLRRHRLELEYKPQTRSARLRELPDEELASVLLAMHDGATFCANLPECCFGAQVPRERCVGCMMAWLAETEVDCGDGYA